MKNNNQDMRVVSVGLSGGRDYDIFIGQGATYKIANLLPFTVDSRSAFIVTDENASPYARVVATALGQAGAWPVHTLTLLSGEETKSFDELQDIVRWLLDRKVRRSSPVFAVGGGVVGDITGFAAAITLRGVPFIQVPTTLLAQVDSSVGGKTGLNVSSGKNLVGAFHQPKSVIIDTDTLGSLDDRQMRAGYAEILKYAILGDPDLFEWLEENGQKVIKRDADAITYVVAQSCKAKAQIIEEDELETAGGRRALLNLGHTFGHALEAACGYDGKLLHGEAVSIGMAIAMDVSVRMGLCPQGDMNRTLSHMQSVGLPVSASEITGFNKTADDLFSLMQNDKKIGSGGMLNFVLLDGIGQAFMANKVPKDIILSALSDSISA